MIKIIIFTIQFFLVIFLLYKLLSYANDIAFRKEQEQIKAKITEIEEAAEEAEKIKKINLNKFKENKKKIKDFKES